MSRRHREHPADITADRLAKHYEHWFDCLSPSEHGDFERVINALREIATEERLVRR